MLQLAPDRVPAVLKEQLSFEDFILEISSKFIDIPVSDIDSCIEDVQKQICQFMGVDLSLLWQWSDTVQKTMELTHLHSPEDGPKRPARLDPTKEFPWSYQQVLKGKTVVIHTSQMTDEASPDRASRLRYGSKSTVVVPLKVGGGPVIGALSFTTLREEREWAPETVKRIELLAQIFGNALNRKSIEMKLRESEARLLLATESAGAGIWEYDIHTKKFWVAQSARSILGLNANVEVTREIFEESIHLEDLSAVHEMFMHSLESGNPLRVEYRSRSEAEGVKWILLRGKPFLKANGKADRLLGLCIDISQRKCLDLQLKERLEEIESLKQQLEGENYYLRQELQREQGFEHIVGKSKVLKKVLLACKQVATTDATVLILGETGTGKGLLASAIHNMSARKNRMFVTVNCAALPANLIESELFGREKGAFTGAHARQAGRFEIADQGTIFLDEIGELSLEMQAKLLRVLQDGEFERLGSAKTVKVDARIIAATARDLRQAVQEGRFRQDLFYRLNVFPITMPPLRQRKEDIVLLAQHFVEKIGRKMGKHIRSIPKRCIDQMLQYDWPGNVREFEHLIERSLIISEGSSFTLADHLGSSPAEMALSVKNSGNDLASIERDHILQVLRMTEWKIEGPGGAAMVLKLHPSTLRFRIKKLGIVRPL